MRRLPVCLFDVSLGLCAGRQLLEERDLLQLRLSSALRSNQGRAAETAQAESDQHSADVQQLKIKYIPLPSI